MSRSKVITGGDGTRKLVLGGGGAIPAGNAGEFLKSDGTGWAGATIAAKDVGTYSTAEVDTKLSSIVLGMEHSVSVVAVTDTPPASPTAFAVYIVGKTPTGAWAGQANQLAEWDGAAWKFTAPAQGEAHFAEETNETWHWNGTGWVKVGKAVLNLDDLNDVAAQSPADGNTLEYSNKQWRAVPKQGSSGSTLFNPPLRAVGAQEVVLDLGTTNWHRVDIEGVIEVQDMPTHLTWSGMDAADTPALLIANLKKQATQLAWSGSSGRDGRGYYVLDREWHRGDHFSLTWLAGTASGTGSISVDAGPYSPFKISFQRMYNDFLIVTTSLDYVSYSGSLYQCEHRWCFDASSRNFQKLAIAPISPKAHIAVNGQYTLH